jgi:hypothetical protein
MSKRFKYEIPQLVGLNAENAAAATCDSGDDAYGWHCTEGSAPASCRCSTGSYAEWCQGTGNSAHDSSVEGCWGCCSTGNGVSAPKFACMCMTMGSGATWSCDYGGNAGEACGGGGNNYGACW